jgi:hypothetical protein
MHPLTQEPLTHIGPGTRMGAFLRRYWHPIAASCELATDKTLGIRLDPEVFELPQSERWNAVTFHEIDSGSADPVWPEHDPRWMTAPVAVCAELDAVTGDPQFAPANREAARKERIREGG